MKLRLCWGFAFEPLIAGSYSLMFACVLVCFRGSVEKHRLCWGFASEPYLAGDCTLLFARSSAFGVQLRSTGYAGASLPNLTLLVIAHFICVAIMLLARQLAGFSCEAQVVLELHFRSFPFD